MSNTPRPDIATQVAWILVAAFGEAGSEGGAGGMMTD
jgi:hypothetical protein